MKTPKDKLIEWLEKQTEKDKWDSGMKNNYFQWCDLRDKVEDFLK